MFFSNESSIILFVIIFGLRFFGQGAMSHAGETTMARYFGENRGKALSISFSGGKIGLMVLPFIAIYTTNLVGWKNIWLLSSLSILIFFIPLLFLILQNQSLRHSNFSKNSEKSTDNKKWKTRDILFDKKFYIYLPISIASSFIGTGLMFHQIFIITEKGWTLNMLANGFIFLGIFSLIGLIIGGPLVDKFKARRVVSYSLIPLLLTILVLVFFDNYLFMLIYMSLLGVSIGVTTPILGSLWAELYGLESIGSVKALLHSCMGFFSAISPLVCGNMIYFGLGILSIALLSLIIIFISTLLPISYKNFNE
jgi:MFS family permease